MRSPIISKAFGTALLLQAAISLAAAPASAPAGTTGMCKDGTYYSGPTKSGACRGHKGVKDWYGAAAVAAPATPAPTPAKPAPAAPPPAAAATPAAAPPTPTPAPKAQTQTPTLPPAPKIATAPSGGSGKVWVNKSTKVYHCAGTRWYGKTKEGEYLREAEAASQGYKPDHGKACK